MRCAAPRVQVAPAGNATQLAALRATEPAPAARLAALARRRQSGGEHVAQALRVARRQPVLVRREGQGVCRRRRAAACAPAIAERRAVECACHGDGGGRRRGVRQPPAGASNHPVELVAAQHRQQGVGAEARRERPGGGARGTALGRRGGRVELRAGRRAAAGVQAAAGCRVRPREQRALARRLERDAPPAHAQRERVQRRQRHQPRRPHALELQRRSRRRRRRRVASSSVACAPPRRSPLILSSTIKYRIVCT